MNKKLIAGLGVALVAGVIMGATVLGGAFASPNGGVPESNNPAVEAPISGSAIIMEATDVKDGTLPDLSNEDGQVIQAAGTVMVSSGGLMSAGSDGTIRLPEGLTLNADGTITDAERNVVGGTATIVEATPGEDLPVLDVNDPNVHAIPAGSVTLNANGVVSTEK